MTDAEHDALKADINRHFDWWVEWLGLAHWEWEIEWHRSVMPDSQNAGSGTTRTLMRIETNPDRMTLYIDVDMPSIANHLAGKLAAFDDPLEALDARERAIERTVVHELVHALVAELRPIAYADNDRMTDPIVERSWREWIFHEERVVAQLTLSFLWVANQGRKRPRRVAVREAKRAAKALATEVAA